MADYDALTTSNTSCISIENTVDASSSDSTTSSYINKCVNSSSDTQLSLLQFNDTPGNRNNHNRSKCSSCKSNVSRTSRSSFKCKPKSDNRKSIAMKLMKDKMNYDQLKKDIKETSARIAKLEAQPCNTSCSQRVKQPNGPICHLPNNVVCHMPNGDVFRMNNGILIQMPTFQNESYKCQTKRKSSQARKSTSRTRRYKSPKKRCKTRSKNSSKKCNIKSISRNSSKKRCTKKPKKKCIKKIGGDKSNTIVKKTCFDDDNKVISEEEEIIVKPSLKSDMSIDDDYDDYDDTVSVTQRSPAIVEQSEITTRNIRNACERETYPDGYDGLVDVEPNLRNKSTFFDRLFGLGNKKPSL